MSKHARLSASKSHLWVPCAGAIRMAEAFPEKGRSFAANEGTALHWLAEFCLSSGMFSTPEHLYGMTVYVDPEGECHTDAELAPEVCTEHVLTPELLDIVDEYLKVVEEYKGDDGTLFVEMRESIEHLTGEEGAEGTADAVIVRGTELQIHDLKTGRTPVEAKDNTQLLMYASAVCQSLSAMLKIETVMIKIHQPRLNAAPEHWYHVDELYEWEDRISAAASLAQMALDCPETGVATYLEAGDHCGDYYCPARGHCPKLTAWSVESVELAGDPLGLNLGALSLCAQKTKAIKDWCEQVMNRVHEEIVAGNEVPGYKAVMGRKGDRVWADAEAVEDTLKRMKIKHEHIYTYKLASPASIEKAAKTGLVGPKQWTKLQDMITRAPAKVTVAPISDKRPAVNVVDPTDEFDDLS